MKITKHAKYIKALIEGFRAAMPISTIEKLYEEHKIETNLRNIALVKEFRGRDYSAVPYFKQPAASVADFKFQYLNAVLILKLLESTENRFLQNLDHTDIAYLLNFATPIPSIELEQRVQRILKRPKNITIIDDLRLTYRDITFESNQDSTSF